MAAPQRLPQNSEIEPARQGAGLDSGGHGALLPEGKVRLLDPHTVNQIAAGEVIERPASVVKELVENALDAGATRIHINVLEAGRKLITCQDNGAGMDAADLSAALLRHATSKIRTAGDLLTVASLGFRGEALPSIASVSRLRMSSGSHDGLRHVISGSGGSFEPLECESGPCGTEVSVEDLFFNTPARLKFLRSDARELAAIVEAVEKACLAFPDVAFRLSHQGMELVATTGSGSLLEALGEVWGADTARALAGVSGLTGAIRVRGFVSPPHFTKPTRSHQWIFVNGRPIRSKTLTAAVDQAYRSLTPERRFPVVLLHLDVDPAAVDVNVSPTKSEVRFQSEGAAFDAVRHALRAALLESGMVPSAEGIAAVNEAMATVSGSQPSFEPTWGAAILGLTGREPIPIHGETGVDGQRSGFAGGDPFGDSPYPGQRAGDRVVPAASLRAEQFLEGLRVLGQSMNTFIIAESRLGILIVDQHVAHERILYERIRDARSAGGVALQDLLTPETLELDRRSAELVRDRLAELETVGFCLEEFGTGSFLVRSVPAAVRGGKPLALLKDMIDELADGVGSGCLSPAADSIWIMSACKMAIKAGDPLAPAEMERLIVDLAHTENPYLCPHGRPITLVLSRGDLLRKFKRS